MTTLDRARSRARLGRQETRTSRISEAQSLSDTVLKQSDLSQEHCFEPTIGQLLAIACYTVVTARARLTVYDAGSHGGNEDEL